jgi:hypothetical protein
MRMPRWLAAPSDVRPRKCGSWLVLGPLRQGAWQSSFVLDKECMLQ